MQMPKIHIPFFVIGEVTQSVAMKNAPSKNPPAKIWNRGLGYLSGSTIQKIPPTYKHTDNHCSGNTPINNANPNQKYSTD